MTAVKKFRLKDFINKLGLPTFIILVFVLFIITLGGILGLSVTRLISDTINRVGMNGLLVLAMVPSIQSGTGPNFALAVGIVCGLLAMVCSIAFNFTGWGWLICAIVLAIILAVGAGLLYGKLLNAVKGAEMTIATYTGFSIVSLMCLVWLLAPIQSENMKWFIGDGLRETIQLDTVNADGILNKFGSFQIGNIVIPTGMLLFFALACVAVWLFFKSKTGIAVSAVGGSEPFSAASGLNGNKYRIIANIISTILGALGIIVYAQSFGYVQLYSAPLNMAFAAVAGVLIGGASAKKAKVFHAVLGVILFQSLLTMALPVANEVFVGTDLSETLRMIIQNGIILYALTQVKGGKK